jgi:hypothetical protein
MSEADRKIGFWSILMLTITGYLYAISYALIVVLFPNEPWVDINTFALSFVGLYKLLFTVTQVLAWLLSLLFVFVGVVIVRQTSEDKKIYSTIGLVFASIFLTMSSIHYYIQWTTVNAGLISGNFDGLSMLVQSNFDAPISVINILGWTLFFGIANTFFALCFAYSGREKSIKTGLLISGVMSVVTAILFAMNIKIIMLAWTIVLVGTWYVYPVMLKGFYKPKV